MEKKNENFSEIEKNGSNPESYKVSKFDKFFKITERGSNVKTEIMAGLTTFFAMAYIDRYYKPKSGHRLHLWR